MLTLPPLPDTDRPALPEDGPQVAMPSSQELGASPHWAVLHQPSPASSPNTDTHTATARESLLNEPFDWFCWMEIEGFSNTVTGTNYPDYVLRHKSQLPLQDHSRTATYIQARIMLQEFV